MFIDSIGKNDYNISHTCQAPMKDADHFEAELRNWWYNTTQNPDNVPLYSTLASEEAGSKVGQGIWECPFDQYDFEGMTCKVDVPCSIKEWKKWCGDQMKMSLYVQPEMKFYWLIS